MVVAATVAVATPASAACHIAGFLNGASEVSESDDMVSVTVFLQGRQPSCEGTVDFATVDGEATAGEDYEATTGTLSFAQGDDREETFVVPILADDEAEGPETFTITLSNATGGISGTGDDMTVTILDAASGEASDGEAGDGDGADGVGEPATDDDGNGVVLVVVVLAVLVALGGGIMVSRRGRAA